MINANVYGKPYDTKTGRFVSKTSALKSSVYRRQIAIFLSESDPEKAALKVKVLKLEEENKRLISSDRAEKIVSEIKRDVKKYQKIKKTRKKKDKKILKEKIDLAWDIIRKISKRMSDDEREKLSQYIKDTFEFKQYKKKGRKTKLGWKIS